MAEEKNNELTSPALTPDDVDALRFILHRVRGISPVSLAHSYAPSEEEHDE